MIITREKGMRMWGGGSGSTSASGVNGGGGFSLAVTEGEGTGNAYTDFTYESGILTLNKGSEFVTVDFFNKLFTAYDANGNVIAPNNTTPTLDNIKFKAGAWTEQYLSALGQNSSGGGGGGGIELSDVWQSLKTNTDDYANQKINAAHIPDLSGTYATKTWVNQQGFVTSSGVTSVATGTGLTGGTITSTGTISINSTYQTYISNGNTAYGYFNSGGVAKVAAKLNTGTTTYTAWGQTYWSSGVPQSISGNMTSVGSITPSANGNALGTTSARFNIYGTAGNFSGNVSITGTLGVTGATTLSSTLSVAGGITLTTTKKIYFGDTSHYLELDSNGYFHFSHGIYSDSFVSALGANSSGGGSGTFDEEAMWEALGTTSTAKVIALSHIPNLSASKITSGTFDTARIPNLDASKITSGTFAAARIPDLSGRYYALYGGTPLNATSSSHYDLDTLTTVGSYYCTANVIAQYFDNKPTNDNYAFRVWVSAPTGISSSYVRQRFQYYNRMTIYERISTSDSGISWGDWYLVQNNLGNYALASDYLPLTGGTLTGTLAMKFDTDTSRAWGYQWKNTSGTSIASIIYHNTAQNIILNPVGSSETWSDAVGKYSLIVGNNSLTYNTYPILHSNNYSSYALPLSGGTLTGNVTFNGVNKGIYLTDSGGNTFAGIIQNGTNLWIGAQQTTATHHTGGTYISAGDNRNLFVSKLVDNTRTNYIILDADNTYTSSGKGYIFGTEITTISGNAATATTASKLSTTSKTAWGQTYWTSGGVPTSISGNLSDVGNITADYYTLNNTAANPYLKLAHTYNSTNYNYYIQAYTGLLYIGAGSANSMAISSTGQVFLAGHLFLDGAQAASSTANTTQIIFRASNTQQVAISSNSSALIINPTSSTTTKQIVLGVGSVASTFGNSITCSGEVTASSDGRKKNIISNTKFNVKDIASARSVLFEWNDGRDDDMEKKIHGGSIAQDWIGKADSFLSQDKDGWYSINYGALALCSAITIAKEVVKHEDEITRLKKEVVKLRERVDELEERRA